MKNNRKSSGGGAGGSGGKSNDEFELKINSMKLVRLVRSQEVLYNSAVDGYTDKAYKESVWDGIHRALFPKYDTFEPMLQEAIRTNVRRRWKTLRDGIAREVKKNATVENYCRKKESPVIAELEFLIPHIKSAHCVRLADELGLREHFSYSNEANEEQEEESFNDLIDLTEDFDIKPIIKSDEKYSFNEDEGDASNDTVPQEALYPTVHVNVMNTNSNETHNIDAQANWNREFCTVAQFRGGEFITSIFDQDNADSPSEEEKVNTSKRARTETNEESTELQAKILQLLSNLERRERADLRGEQDAHDEDRMFLLSLVSDLRRVPAAKKMQVKAEIANAIARANQ